MAAPTVSALEAAGAAAGDSARPRRAERLDRALAWITEVPAALLVALEIIVLFAGVASLLLSSAAFALPLLSA